MFPIRSNNPTHSTAYVTIGLIAVNSLMFLYEVTRSDVEIDRFTWKYGFVPAQLVSDGSDFEREFRREKVEELGREFVHVDRDRILLKRNGDPMRVKEAPPEVRRRILASRLPVIKAEAKAAAAVPAWLNIFTCMFLHGGWMHLIGNMLFLWIFGHNIEDRLGPWLFIVFYLGTGVCGNLAHTFFDASYIPLVGASGAISGVMGGYILSFPSARILAIVPIGWYPATFSLPAWVYLVFYLLAQNLWPAYFGMGAGNVAYWAHIGGFAAGMAMIFVFPHRKQPPRTAPLHHPDDDDADFVI